MRYKPDKFLSVKSTSYFLAAVGSAVAVIYAMKIQFTFSMICEFSERQDSTLQGMMPIL